MRLIEDLPAAADVVIIGGGIVGTATAFFLAKAGFRPILVEAADTLAARTTLVSAHAIRCQFSEPENIAQMSESLSIYTEFRDVLGDPSAQIDLTQNGYLFASTDPDDRTSFATRVETQQRLGVHDVELLDGDEIRYRFPWMSDHIVVGSFRRADGWIDSVAAANAFATASCAAVALNTQVTEILGGTRGVTGVLTTKGTIATERVVLAAGPFSRQLSPEPLPVALWRRHRLVVDPDTRVPQDAPMTIDANTGAHWRPHRGGALMAWAQVETDREAEWPVVCDPAWPDLILRNERGIQRLCPFWAEIVPQIGPANTLFTAGMYTVTPDHKPLIGPAMTIPGLWLNTGYSGHGIMGSPSGSRLLADLIAGTLTEADNPFSPGRFALGTKPPDVEKIVL
ncbi:MAG TPA: FAD-binding oxidoreductase [Thermomicrobiales bacterium]|nr:FAD-binding oxidoreductase [Thermomicrobiales bacterium]